MPITGLKSACERESILRTDHLLILHAGRLDESFVQSSCDLDSSRGSGYKPPGSSWRLEWLLSTPKQLELLNLLFRECAWALATVQLLALDVTPYALDDLRVGKRRDVSNVRDVGPEAAPRQPRQPLLG